MLRMETRMASVVPILIWAAAAALPPEGAQGPCPEFAGAAAAVDRLAELPPEIREHLLSVIDNNMGDPNSILLRTDAVTDAERGQRTSRLVRGLRFRDSRRRRDMWLIQYEAAMRANVHTISYEIGPEGRFRFTRRHFFSGPACESVRAALNGVTTPGGP